MAYSTQLTPLTSDPKKPSFGSNSPPATSAATKHSSKSAGCSSAVGNESPLLGGVRLQPSKTPLRTQAETCSQPSCALNSQTRAREEEKKNNNKTSSFLSLLPCFCLFPFSLFVFFLRYQRLQSPPLVSGNISCETWTDVNRVLLQQGSFAHLQAGSHAVLRREAGARPSLSFLGCSRQNSLFLSSLV